MAGPSVISSSTYPENDWGGDADVAGSFTFDANGVSDAAAYEYSLDVQTLNRVVNTASPGSSETVSITPLTPGWHSLWARTRDSAGNVTEVRNYPFKVGNGEVTSPTTGDVTGAKLTLSSDAAPSFSNATYQWRRAGSDPWVNIPTTDVTYSVGGGTVASPVSLTNGTAPKLNWDAAATLASVDAAGIPRDGPVQVRAFFNPNSNGAPANTVKFRFDRNLASADTAEVGPGSVNLITGNYQLEQTDVSVAGLEISRTVNSRQPSGRDPLFGPGWVSGLVVADAYATYSRLTTYGSLVQIKLPDDSTIGFTKVNSAGVTYEPQIGAESYKLTFTSASSTFILDDGQGNIVTFTRASTDPTGVYTPAAATTTGSGTTTYSWEKVTVGATEIMRPTRILAPTPEGITCATLGRGCRALTFAYATATTATGLADGTWGDYLGRVKEISYTAWDPDLTTPAMRTTVLARYTYDSGGRLRTFSDPRLDYVSNAGPQQVRTVYYYNGNGIITTMTPPAQQTWQFSYTTTPNDPGNGRLHKVTRSALAAGTAVETVVYHVPISGAGAPYNFSAGQTARWGQTEPPTDATAVFPPSQIPAGDPTAGTLPTSYERATVTYLDANAREVNLAQPGDHIHTTWYDRYGNIVRELDPGNRARALDASPNDNPVAEAQIAALLSTENIYALDGELLMETFNPEHEVTLSPSGTVVRGRAHTRYTYDEGAPQSGGPYNLATTTRTSISYVQNGQTVDEDVRTTIVEYDWTLRIPTVTTIDPGGLDLTTRASYDAAGRVIANTTPAGGSTETTPATRIGVYYTNAANAEYPECGGHPEWVGMQCLTHPGGAAESGPELLTTVTSYDFYGQPRIILEKNSAGTQRTTTVTYDNAGRAVDTSLTAAVGAEVEKRRRIYDQASGQLVRTQSLNNAGAVVSEIVRSYDSLGQQTSYTDAAGNISTTTYDLLGRIATSFDGKGTRTFTYDEGDEHRGLPTSVAGRGAK